MKTNDNEYYKKYQLECTKLYFDAFYVDIKTT